MRYFEHTITGLDGTQAQFTGYCIDNNDEVDPHRHRSAVLVIPGGGYEMTSEREAEPIALRFVSAGYQAFVLRYSVWPSLYPTALVEAAEAMQEIRIHADQWHVKAEEVAVIGFSAGGHLAANLATTAGDESLREQGYDPDAIRPNALMLAYPVVTTGALGHHGSFTHLLGKQSADQRLLEELSIEKHIDEKTPLYSYGIPSRTTAYLSKIH